MFYEVYLYNVSSLIKLEFIPNTFTIIYSFLFFTMNLH